MICLETDFLVAFTRGEKEAEEKMLSLKSRFRRLTYTPVSASELFFGAFKSRMQNAEHSLQGFLSTLEILEFDLPAALEAGKIMHYLEKEGQKIGERDMLIAGIALRHGQTLVTRNRKHYSKIKGLKIEEW